MATYIKFVKFSQIRKTTNHSYYCSPKIEKYCKYNFDLVRWILGCKWPINILNIALILSVLTTVCYCVMLMGEPHQRAPIIKRLSFHPIISSSARDVFFVKWQIDSVRPAYCAVCKSNTWKQVLKKMRLPMQRHTAEPELMNFLVLV